MSKADALINQLQKITSKDQKALAQSVQNKKTTSINTETNTKMILRNIGKWGIPPAAAGAGAGLGVLGLSAGVKEAFGIEAETEQEKKDSTKKITGWILFAALVTLFVVVLLPRIKKAVK